MQLRVWEKPLCYFYFLFLTWHSQHPCLSQEGKMENMEGKEAAVSAEANHAPAPAPAPAEPHYQHL